MNASIIHDNIYSLIDKKCHLRSYHSDIRYHITLNIIFSVLRGYQTSISRDPTLQISTSFINYILATEPRQQFITSCQALTLGTNVNTCQKICQLKYPRPMLSIVSARSPNSIICTYHEITLYLLVYDPPHKLCEFPN